MDFDIGSWFDDFSLDDFGKAAQVAGVATSTIGAFYSTLGQKNALASQSALDVINARSVFAASEQQLGLDWINAQLGFSSVVHNANMDVLGAQMKADMMRGESEISLIRAGASASSAMAAAQIDDNEAYMAELRAQSSLLHGQWDEQDVRMKSAQVKSKRRTRLAASGIDLGAGTTAAVLTSDEVIAETEVTKVREKALLAALGYRQAAVNAGISANAKRAQAGATMAAASLSAALTESQATSLTAMAIADADYKKAMADAGLANSKAAVDLRRVLAEGNLANAEASAESRRTTADNMSPWLSATSSLISGAGKVAESWYRYNRTQY